MTAAADETPLQHGSSPQSASEATAMPRTAADGAKAEGGAQLPPGRKLPRSVLRVRSTSWVETIQLLKDRPLD